MGTGVDELIPSRPDICLEPEEFPCHCRNWWPGHAQKIKRLESVFLPQLLQEYQMMADCPGHGGVLPIRDPKLFGSLLHNPGQRSIVGMAHERAQVVGDVMVKPAHEPTDKRVFGCII